MPRCRIRGLYEQLLEFEIRCAIEFKEAGWANRRIALHMGRSDATIRRFCQDWEDRDGFHRHDGCGRPRATVDLEDRSAITGPDPSLSIIKRVTRTRVSLFSDESLFQLSPDDHQRRVWRRPGQRAAPDFSIARHTGPQSGVKLWGANSFDSRILLVVVRDTLAAQRYLKAFIQEHLQGQINFHIHDKLRDKKTNVCLNSLPPRVNKRMFINVTLLSNARAIGDGPRIFEPWLSDENFTWTGTKLSKLIIAI
ncbi:HTH_Tnp_Tc3_2 domain-containing protein [Trichonephila clavipes]|uniref:HTH_Tnp_Tc3_2 domain-containing protein n=1 Tax=Trichonephila clavipes TaxID=2585209 RepID=A0A8X6WCV3_TRICX|nr:HTH_Tnp_Tc3_2 domain-containing protein [Trichonephila clavipes]